MKKYIIKNGFTLIELLIVISVIGILATAVLVVINPLGQSAKARDAIRKHDVKNLVTVFKMYEASTGSFPQTGTTNCIGLSTGSNCWGDRNIPGNTTLMNMLAPFVKTYPKDPRSSGQWGDRYLYLDGGAVGAGTPTGNVCDNNKIQGHYILWRPEKQPASDSDCQSFGYYSCCGSGGAPCGNNGGYYCAYRLD